MRLLFSRITLLTITIALASTCTITFCAEPDSVSSAGAPGLDAKRYYDMGYRAGKQQHLGAGPFLIGTLTGVTAPIASIGAGAAISSSRSSDAAGAIVGVGVLGLWIYWGGRLTRHLYKPDIGRISGEYTPVQWNAVEQGYHASISGKRSIMFSVGVMLGVTADIVFVAWMIGTMLSGLELN